jgi:hypothetical protein
MKKLPAAVAAAVAVFAMASLSGVAFAGDHHGDHGSKAPKAPAQNGQAKHEQAGHQQKSGSSPAQSGANPEPKVYICHATGSATNPYVLIHVSSHALPAHTRHQDGRDIVLGPNPGACPTVAAQTKQQEQPASSGVKAAVKTNEQAAGKGKVFICHATGSATNPFVLIHVSVNAVPAHTRHQDGRDIVLGDKPGPCPTAQQQQQQNAAVTPAAATPAAATPAAVTPAATAPAAAAATQPAATAATAPTSGVKGASKTIAAPAASSTPSSGVLGAAKTLGRTATTGTLPFTGLRLWIVELIALGMIGGGVAMRLIARRRTN